MKFNNISDICMNSFVGCDCGPDGECTFNNGRKICTCDEDYEDINGYCQRKYATDFRFYIQISNYLYP